MDEVTPAKLLLTADALKDGCPACGTPMAEIIEASEMLRAEAARRATPKSGEAEAREAMERVRLWAGPYKDIRIIIQAAERGMEYEKAHASLFESCARHAHRADNAEERAEKWKDLAQKFYDWHCATPRPVRDLDDIITATREALASDPPQGKEESSPTPEREG